MLVARLSVAVLGLAVLVWAISRRPPLLTDGSVQMPLMRSLSGERKVLKNL